jgi:hypothetical protein
LIGGLAFGLANSKHGRARDKRQNHNGAKQQFHEKT